MCHPQEGISAMRSPALKSFRLIYSIPPLLRLILLLVVIQSHLPILVSSLIVGRRTQTVIPLMIPIRYDLQIQLPTASDMDPLIPTFFGAVRIDFQLMRPISPNSTPFLQQPGTALRD